MLRLALRRDRILVPAWVLGIAGMATMSAQATVGLYPDLPQRVQAAEAINGSAALIALYGRIYDPTSLGELSLFKMTAFGAAMVGVLMIILVVRHTRAEEETGRLELVGSTVVGRAAPLAAGMLLAAITAAGIAVLTAAGLAMAGLPVVGSIAFGAAWGATGLLFAAVGGITAQLSVSARAATGLGLVVVAVAYVARAVGDLAEGGPGWLSWLSPIGWSQQVRAFSGTRWGMLVLPLVATVILVAIAFLLRRGRDLGAGLLADRPGPAEGRISLHVGAVLAPAAPGLPGVDGGRGAHGDRAGQRGETASVASSTPRPWRSSSRSWVVGRASWTPSSPRSSGSSARWSPPTGSPPPTGCRPRRRAAAPRSCSPPPPRGAVGRRAMRSSRCSAWPCSRSWSGLAVGLGYALSVGEPDQVWRLGLAATARIPAAWVMVGLAVAIWGFWPRLSWLAWVLFVGFLVMGEFGVLWDIPEWVRNLSPFAHSPVVPGPDPHYLGIPVMVVNRRRPGRRLASAGSRGGTW